MSEHDISGKQQAQWRLPRERDWRLWAGIVLFVFVTTHLLNHALGIFGVTSMEAVQRWRIWLWQSSVGTFLLYGALLVHAILALKRMARRRISYLALEDGIQIVLGIAIPFMLISHVVGTRVATLYGQSLTYSEVLDLIWQGAPTRQILLLLTSWIHGCIGIGQMIRAKPWYRRWRDFLIIAGCLIPALALAGFFSAAREVAAFHKSAGPIPPDTLIQLLMIARWLMTGLSLLIGLFALLILWRLLKRVRAGFVTVRYIGHGSVRIPRGTTVLEASRANRIPHPAQCGGRGRCSTCRVAVTSDPASMPPPGTSERATLERISAPANVRLACQLRPDSEIAVQILLPIVPTGQSGSVGNDLYRWGSDREITALFIDIRAFNLMAKVQIPYDLVLLMNRFMQEMTQAAEAHGGRVDAFAANGLVAIFGLDSLPSEGAANAIRAARDMLRTIEELNKEFGAALALPLRAGIGIHSGSAIIGRIGDARRGMRLAALGDTISIACHLEEATKEYLADCLISAETASLSGMELHRLDGASLQVAARNKPVVLYSLEPLA